MDGTGGVRYCGVWFKDGKTQPGWRLTSADEHELRGTFAAGEYLAGDIDLGPATGLVSHRAAWQRDRERQGKTLAEKPDDLNALRDRAAALFWLDADAEAFKDLDAYLAKSKSPSLYSIVHRAILHARAGRADKAREDLRTAAGRKAGPPLMPWGTALVHFHLGEDEKAVQTLDVALKARPGDAALQLEAAAAMTRGSRVVAVRPVVAAVSLVGQPWSAAALAPPRQAVKPDALAERALGLLREAMDRDAEAATSALSRVYFEPLHDHPGFREMVARARLDRRYASVWAVSTTREGEALLGLDAEAHLDRCRELAAKGYRPQGLALAVLPGGKAATAASVWHRPVPPPLLAESDARTRAAAAATLLRLDSPEDAWELFKFRPDPTARSFLVERCNSRGVDPLALVHRLDEEKDASARRALVLALGDYTPEQLPPALRGPLTKKLLGWYKDDPDPGLHGAIDWLLRHAKDGPADRPLDWGAAADLAKIDAGLKRQGPDPNRRWYVNGQGQTLVLVTGPAEFRMGSPPSDPDRVGNSERPHLRRIPRSYAVGSRSVTVEEFQRFLKDRPDVLRPTTNRYSSDRGGPMIGVSWFMAAQYCNWLSEQEGIPESEWCYPKHADVKDGMRSLPNYLKRTGYRLPTEAEWEYACRAGTTTARYYGNSPELLPRYAWYNANAVDRALPVGQKRPNDLGLFDTHGNVWNWCQDVFQAYPAMNRGRTIIDNEDSSLIEDKFSRLLRGGSFDVQPSLIRSPLRVDNRPSFRNISNGLRVARTYR